MNAVKRCLALIAATVAVGACSGDPTADLAGANLTIRATPGAVWMRADKTTTVLVEAVDGTGAPTPGNWTASKTGVIDSVVADAGFQPTNGGPLGNGRQYIIYPASEGNGTVTFTGTAGDLTVPVRIAPAPTAFAATVTPANPNIGDTITVTAPAGLRFTDSTTVSFTGTNGHADPILVSMAADSLSFRFLPGPSAQGQVKVTGIASVQTPTLISSAATSTVVTVEKRDSIGETLSANPAAPNSAVTITMPAGTTLRSTSVVSNDAYTTFPVIEVSRAVDGSSITVIPPPGFDTALTINDLKDSRIPAMSLTLPTAKLKTTTADTAPQAMEDAGPDDPADPANPSYPVPVNVGDMGGWFDRGTFGIADPTCDAGPGGAQFYTVTVANTGDYTFSVEWSSGTDIDFGIMVKDGSYGSCSNFLDFGGLSSSDPETFTAHLTAGTTYVLAVINFGDDTDASTQIQVTVKREN